VSYNNIKEFKEGKRNLEDIPEEFRCPPSSQGVHYYAVFPFGKGFVAICERCLKAVKINP
jgi:hypothetical protein